MGHHDLPKDNPNLNNTKKRKFSEPKDPLANSCPKVYLDEEEDKEPENPDAPLAIRDDFPYVFPITARQAQFFKPSDIQKWHKDVGQLRKNEHQYTEDAKKQEHKRVMELKKHELEVKEQQQKHHLEELDRKNQHQLMRDNLEKIFIAEQTEKEHKNKMELMDYEQELLSRKKAKLGAHDR